MAAQRLEQDQHEERRGDGERDGERATLVVVLRQRRGRVVAALAAIGQRWKRGGGEEDEASEEMQFGDLRKAKGLTSGAHGGSDFVPETRGRKWKPRHSIGQRHISRKNDPTTTKLAARAGTAGKHSPLEETTRAP